MKKTVIMWAVCAGAALIGMVAAPLFLPKGQGDTSMFAIFILWYLVNPLLSAGGGVAAGLNLRQMWPWPVVPPLLFALGMLLAFPSWDSPLTMMAVSYFGLAAIAMLLTALIVYSRKLKKEQERRP